MIEDYEKKGGSAEVRVHQPKFVSGQDGPYERILKSRLSELFCRKMTIRRAYLARAELADTSTGVILYVSAEGDPDEYLIDEIGVVFGSLFPATEHLGIVFITSTQESWLQQMCGPFYVQAA